MFMDKEGKAARVLNPFIPDLSPTHVERKGEYGVLLHKSNSLNVHYSFMRYAFAC